MYYPPEAAAGVANTVHAIASQATGHGHQYAIAARTTGDELRYEEYNGILIMRVPRNATLFESQSRLQQFAREFKPDFINFHLSTGYHPASVVEAARDTDARLVYFLHYYQLICRKADLRTEQGNCTTLCEPCATYSNQNLQFTRYADAVSAMSQHTLNRHLQAGHFGGLPSFIAPGMVKPGSVVTRPDHATEDTVFGYLGRISPIKGLIPLLNLARKHQLNLLIAGRIDDKFSTRLKREFESDRIRFLGWQDPHEFMSQIDYCVVPSLFEEPSARVGIEAQSCGVPVLVSRVGGQPETFIQDKTGYGYDPLDVADFERVLLHARQTRSIDPEACRQHAHRYSPEVVWPRYEAFFADLLARPRNTLLSNRPSLKKADAISLQSLE